MGGKARRRGARSGRQGRGDKERGKGGSLTTYSEDPEQAHQDSNVREHHAEGDHGNPLSDDIIDKEVAATGQRCAHQAGDTSCSTHTHTHTHTCYYAYHYHWYCSCQ